MVILISHAEPRQNGAAMTILGIALADYAKTNSLQDQAIAVCSIEIRLHKHFLKLQKEEDFRRAGHGNILSLRATNERHKIASSLGVSEGNASTNARTVALYSFAVSKKCQTS